MKRRMKIFVGAVVALVLIPMVFFFSIDAMAKAAIERGATYALGVQTTLGSADIRVFRGDFRMKDLSVANPEGFDAKQFLQLGEGHVVVSLSSLRQHTVELPSLELSNLQMSLEKKGSKSNYGQIADNLKRFESGGGEEAAKKEKGRGYVIREVVIRDVSVDVDLLPVGGALNRVRVPIKEIRLTDVGAKRSLKMGELTDVIIKAILSAVLANAADLPADLANDLGGALKGLSGLGDMGIKTTLDLAGKGAGELGKAAGEIGKGIEDIGKGLGGLLKKK